MATLSISPVSAEQNATRTIVFAGFQANANVTIGVVGGGYFTATADSSGGGMYSLTFGEAVGTYTLQANDSYGHSATASFTVTSGAPTYNPVLSVNTPIVQGGTLSFSFTGFPANVSVWVGVIGGGGIYVTASASGSGSGSFTDNDAPGNYYLQASYSSYSATAAFAISGGGGNVSISVSPSSIKQGSTINVSYTGFPGNALVTLTVVETGGYWTLSTIASGSGTWTDLGPLNDAPGTYTLRATDSYGHSATATLTITSGVASFSNLQVSYRRGV